MAHGTVWCFCIAFSFGQRAVDRSAVALSLTILSKCIVIFISLPHKPLMGIFQQTYGFHLCNLAQRMQAMRRWNVIRTV